MTQRFSSLALSINNTGLWTTLVYKLDRIRKSLGIPAAGLLPLRPKGLAHPLWLRRGRSSDMEVYRAIFIEREYDAVTLGKPPSLILDLGANIGASAVYFLNRYPDARVLSVEPDPANFERCRQNLAPYGERSILVRGGVWSHPCFLQIHSFPAGEGMEWAITVSEAETEVPGSIRAWDIPSLLDLAGARAIDLLKVDIEGSERQLFSASSAKWLPLVRNICIELHGPDCTSVFDQALAGYRHTRSTSGELTICRIGFTAAP